MRQRVVYLMNYHYVIISKTGACEAASTTQYRKHSPPANVDAALTGRKTGTGATRAIKSAKTGTTNPHSTSPPQKREEESLLNPCADHGLILGDGTTDVDTDNHIHSPS